MRYYVGGYPLLDGALVQRCVFLDAQVIQRKSCSRRKKNTSRNLALLPDFIKTTQRLAEIQATTSSLETIALQVSNVPILCHIRDICLLISTSI